MSLGCVAVKKDKVPLENVLVDDDHFKMDLKRTRNLQSRSNVCQIRTDS